MEMQTAPRTFRRIFAFDHAPDMMWYAVIGGKGAVSFALADWDGVLRIVSEDVHRPTARYDDETPHECHFLGEIPGYCDGRTVSTILEDLDDEVQFARLEARYSAYFESV